MKIHATLKIVLVVTFALLIGLASTWVYLRNRGLSDAISPVRHAFLDRHANESIFLIADPALKADPISIDQLKAAANLHPRMILWIDVQITADDQIVILKLRDLALPDRSSRLVGLSKFEELSGIVGKPILKLKEVLTALPEHRFVLNLRDYRPGLDVKLAEEIDDLKAGDRILIQSEQDGILRDLRTLRATWLFGTSQAQITQMLMLLSFGLESIAPIKGDVYVTTSVRGRRLPLEKEVVTEIHRRTRKVFAGPVTDLESANYLREMGVDGMITGNPEALLSLLK